jgi:bis(5'-nucleosyl)-tetraphosphatase (symmetrical)
MATYVIGDIQGCFDSFVCLLKNAPFIPGQDTLWVAGDMINRGPKSLKTLRLIKSMGDKSIAVLGNHDLHLLAAAYGIMKPRRRDTFTEILDAPDRDELIEWLRQQPLVHYDPALQSLMVHAGIPPQWELQEALSYAEEVHVALTSSKIKQFLKNMYGDQPNCWDNSLKGWKRLRLITNYFTRMRICSADGKLDLTHKEGLNNMPDGFKPWFAHAERKTRDLNIMFGHWAALQGESDGDNVYALDTGCVWGGQLTMLRLDDHKVFSCQC